MELLRKVPGWLKKIVLAMAIAALVILLLLYLDGAFSQKVSQRPTSVAATQHQSHIHQLNLPVT
jgi:anti-sigma-K factor RskA